MAIALGAMDATKSVRVIDLYSRREFYCALTCLGHFFLHAVFDLLLKQEGLDTMYLIVSLKH